MQGAPGRHHKEPSRAARRARRGDGITIRRLRINRQRAATFTPISKPADLDRPGEWLWRKSPLFGATASGSTMIVTTLVLLGMDRLSIASEGFGSALTNLRLFSAWTIWVVRDDFPAVLAEGSRLEHLPF